MKQIANHTEQVTVDHTKLEGKNSTALQSVYIIWNISVTGLKHRNLRCPHGKALK